MQENLPAWAHKPIKLLSSVLMEEPDDPLYFWACVYISVVLAGQVFPPSGSCHSVGYDFLAAKRASSYNL